MKSYFKTIYFFLIIAIQLLMLNGCSNSTTNTIRVYSHDFSNINKLDAAEFDSIHITENITNLPIYRVTKKEGQLWIENGEHYEHQKSSVVMGDNGYFVGLNLGHMDGWVRYFPYFSSYPEAGESAVVTDEYFYAFVEVERNQIYLLTTVPTLADDAACGVFYIYLDGKEWKWDKIATLDGYPMAYAYNSENNNLFLATQVGLYSSDQCVNIELYNTPTYWQQLSVNSMVLIEDSLYCGTSYGIYVHFVSSDSGEWYPINHK